MFTTDFLLWTIPLEVWSGQVSSVWLHLGGTPCPEQSGRQHQQMWPGVFENRVYLRITTEFTWQKSWTLGYHEFSDCFNVFSPSRWFKLTRAQYYQHSCGLIGICIACENRHVFGFHNSEFQTMTMMFLLASIQNAAIDMDLTMVACCAI